MDKKRNIMIFCLLMAATCCPVFSAEWKATVVKQLKALVSSCVVVPCSFTHTGGELPASKLRGIWHRSDVKTQNIYHEDPTKILDSFKGRTQILGQLGQGNCTLEIIEIKDHDNGPFCFRIELVKTPEDPPTKEKFSFVEDCVDLKMHHDEIKPELHQPKTPVQGKPFTITCSVHHTCPSHKPKLSWTRGKADEISEIQTNMNFGNWRTESILTFIPEEKDDHTDLTCTAAFNGGLKSSTTITLYIKRTENYNHIIIPVTVAVGTAMIFGLLCIFMVKKYKERIAELQSRDGSMWNRMSRLSRRFRPNGPGPSQSDQRRSIWSRFSKRPKGDTVEFGNSPNNVNEKSSGERKVFKPRIPSPKSQPKSCNYREDLDDGDDYMNTADLSVYGNI
ncbi:sialic acid-binding Ig-like lectin 16 isoform X3 [Melanotaenia boesemani]|nr:sialic acid-binding Ig-like lectin 16 isoform X3 [Melanotaenia boesemani]